MTHADLVAACLVIISLGVGVMTVACLVLMVDLRRTLRHINACIPLLEHTLHQTRRLEARAHQVIAKAQDLLHRLDGGIATIGSMAMAVTNGLASWRGKAETFLAQRFGIGNGSRVEPRRRHRTQRST